MALLKRPVRAAAPARPRVVAPLVGALLAALAAGPLAARVSETQDQALRRVFPPPLTVERRTLYLDEDQTRRAAEEAGIPIATRVVPYYVGLRGAAIAGYAYFDTHVVRTLPETVLVRLTPDGRIEAIDILSFDEPEDYRVSPRFLDQFRGRGPGEGARLPGAIRSMTGATLSARAITDAARRVLAIHRLFVQPAAGGGP